MRARNVSVFVAGLAVMVVGACSNPAADVALERDTDLASELDLALFSAASMRAGEEVVLSEVELGRPRAPEAAASPPPARTPAPVAEIADPVAQIVHAEHVTMAPTPAPVDLGPVEAADDAAAGSSAEEDERGPAVGRTATRGRGIIIRGGGSGNDPCVIHGPGGGIYMPGAGGGILSDPRGTIGIAINDQAPRIGRGAYPPPSRGRTPSMGGGGFFPGGIR